MKYFLKAPDDFSAMNHPWQNGMLKIHIISAVIFLFVLGSITISHIIRKIKMKEKKAYSTGITQIIILIVSIISGYFLQVISTLEYIKIMAYIHIATSFLLIPYIYLHQLIGTKKKKYIALMILAMLSVISSLLLFLV